MSGLTTMIEIEQEGTSPKGKTKDPNQDPGEGLSMYVRARLQGSRVPRSLPSDHGTPTAAFQCAVDALGWTRSPGGI